MDKVNWLVVLVAVITCLTILLARERCLKKRDRWRPINEAPSNRILLLRVPFHEDNDYPIFKPHDRIYYGEVYATMGYMNEDLWYTVGMDHKDGIVNPIFVHNEVRPTEFRYMVDPENTHGSSH